MVRRRRLNCPDIEASTGQMPAHQRLMQRGFIMDAATRGGDEHGTFFHLEKASRIKHVHRLRGAGTMHRDNVGLRQQCIHAHRLSATVANLILTQVGIDCEHTDAKRPRQ